MTRSLIVAVAENGVIGREGGLPWSLPADLVHFEQLTMGHTLIMGRKTFASIGRALPGRRSIVLSRDPTFAFPGVTVAPDLASAYQAAADDTEVFIVGGAAVYAEALPSVDRLHITRVHAAVEGDIRFPPLDERDWILVDATSHDADARHAFAFTIERYDRRPTRAEPATKPIA